MSELAASGPLVGALPLRRRRHRRHYLAAAICLAICTVMVLPLLASVLASLKTPEEAAAIPPTFIPHALSFSSYERLWHFQAGLLTYAANSLVAALLTNAI